MQLQLFKIVFIVNFSNSIRDDSYSMEAFLSIFAGIIHCYNAIPADTRQISGAELNFH